MAGSTIPKFLIYDARYHTDPDDAIVMDTATSLEEAKRAAKEQGDCVIVNAETGEIEN